MNFAGYVFLKEKCSPKERIYFLQNLPTLIYFILFTQTKEENRTKMEETSDVGEFKPELESPLNNSDTFPIAHIVPSNNPRCCTL
jgi:hypothetical protein